MAAFAAAQWQANASKNQLVLGPNGAQAVISAENLRQISVIKISDPGTRQTDFILSDAASGLQTINTDLHLTGDTVVDGNLSVAGTFTPKDVSITDLTVNGNLTVTGNETVGGNLSVAGTFTPAGDMTIPGKLTVSGGAVISGGLKTDINVGGAVPTNIGGVGSVTNILGDLNVAGTFTPAGNMTIPGDLTVVGNTDLQSAVKLSGQLAGNAVPYLDLSKTVQSYVLTDGQLVIGSNGAAPAKNPITSDSPVLITNGPGTIKVSLDATAGAIFSKIALTDNSNQILLGTAGNKATINYDSTASTTTQTLTIPDSGVAAADFLLTQKGPLITNGTQTIKNTTPSTVSTDGALVVSGGVGIAHGLNVAATDPSSILGTTVTLAGTTTTTVGSTTTTSATILQGGATGTLSADAQTVDIGDTVATTVNVGTAATAMALTIGSTTAGSNTTIKAAALGKILLDTAPVSINNGTASITSSTGALIVTGGVGIGGDLNVAGSINGTAGTGTFKNITLTDTSDQIKMNTGTGANTTTISAPTSTTTSQVLNIPSSAVASGESFLLTQVGPTLASGTQTIKNTKSSSTSAIGALVVAGGLGVGETVNIKSHVKFDKDLNHEIAFNNVSAASQSLTITGSSTTGNGNVGGLVKIVAGDSSGTGAAHGGNVTITGGAGGSSATANGGSVDIEPGIKGGGGLANGTIELGTTTTPPTINMGGTATIVNVKGNTGATSSGTGALVVTGGVGIGEKLYVGSGIYLPTAGGVATTLNYYEEVTTFTTTYTWTVGGGATTNASTILIVRIGRLVVLHSGSATNSTLGALVSGSMISNTALAANYRPRTTPLLFANLCVSVFDNQTAATGSVTPGYVQVENSGLIHVYLNTALAGFVGPSITSGNQSGVRGFTSSYVTD